MMKTGFIYQVCLTATTSGTAGSTTFTFSGSSVTSPPNGTFGGDVWDLGTILYPRSNIGFVMKRP